MNSKTMLQNATVHTAYCVGAQLVAESTRYGAFCLCGIQHSDTNVVICVLDLRNGRIWDLYLIRLIHENDMRFSVSFRTDFMATIRKNSVVQRSREWR
ncbi:hypothetical protein ACFJGW_16870 [Burkholderiaceae bacterium UC74_6]